VFHGVTAGTCWLRLDDEPPQQLFAGDVVLLPGGDEHVLASAPRGPATPLDLLAKQRLIDAAGQLRLLDGDPTTQVLCATYAEEGQRSTHCFSYCRRPSSFALMTRTVRSRPSCR
jgi:hypothetical protein